jgi:hypothetical protein
MAVTPRLITVTPNSGQSREYGDANPVLTYALSRTTTGASGAALVNGNTLSGALASVATATSNVADYAINQNDLTGGGNYSISFTGGRTMAVTPRLITVRADDLARDYGLANPRLTYRISSGNLVNGDDFVGSLFTSAGSLSEVGSYAILRGSLTLGTNYAMTFVPGTLTIRARSVETASRTARSFDNRISADLGVERISRGPERIQALSGGRSGGLSGSDAVNVPMVNLRGAATSSEQGSGGTIQRLNLEIDASQQQTLSPDEVKALLSTSVRQGGGR